MVYKINIPKTPYAPDFPFQYPTQDVYHLFLLHTQKLIRDNLRVSGTQEEYRSESLSNNEI